MVRWNGVLLPIHWKIFLTYLIKHSLYVQSIKKEFPNWYSQFARELMNPIQDFDNRYSPEEIEILFTAADSNIVESVHPRIKTRYARQDGLAYINCTTGECINDSCDINWAGPEAEVVVKLREFEAGHTYRLRGGPEAAAPAVGTAGLHRAQQEEIIHQAFTRD